MIDSLYENLSQDHEATSEPTVYCYIRERELGINGLLCIGGGIYSCSVPYGAYCLATSKGRSLFTYLRSCRILLAPIVDSHKMTF
jgi:hypothetical protein